MTATIGGTLLLKPCGSSTITKAIFAIAQETQRPLGVLLVEPGAVAELDRERSSRRAVRRSSSIAPRFSDDGKNQRGYWSRIEPSWPAVASGSRPSRNVRQTSSQQLVRQVLRVDPRLGSRRVRAGPSRMALGRRFVSVPWPVMSACALMSKTKSGGVRSTHRVAVEADRQRVVRRVDLDERERLERSGGGAPPPSWLRPGRRLPRRSSSGPSTTPCPSGSSRRPGSRSARPPLSRPRRRAPRQHRRRDRTLRSSDGALRRWSLDDTGGPGQRRPVSATNDILAPCGPCS